MTGESLRDADAAAVEPERTPAQPDLDRHHGCLTAWIWTAGIVGFLGTLSFGLASVTCSMGVPRATARLMAPTAALSFVSLLFVYGIDNSRRWGVRGFIAVAGVAAALFLASGVHRPPVHLAAFVAVATLWLAMNRGGDRNGWSRLE